MPADGAVAPITIGSLFSGIGGLELGLEAALGARTAWQVEANEFCRRVLAKHWPEATRHDDVRNAHGAARLLLWDDFKQWDDKPLPFVDILCGGFPCQDISLAGRGGGIEHGKRSGLWREFARLIDEVRPRVVVVENVAALARRGLSRVLRDLADLGFVGTWDVVSAAEVGAPHLRRRLFVVAAHPERIKLRDEQGWRSGACWTRARLARHARAPWPVADAVGERGDVALEAGCEDALALGAGRRGTPPDADGSAWRPEAGDAQRGTRSDEMGSGETEPRRRGGPSADTNGDAGDQRRTHHPEEGARGRHADRGAFVVDDANTDRAGLEEQHAPAVAGGARLGPGGADPSWCGWLAPSPVRRVDDGLPAGVDGPRQRRRPANDRHRIHACGNAVVRQVAEVVGAAVADLVDFHNRGCESRPA